MIKLTDYIVKLLNEKGIDQVFMITGGGAMHLNDSFGKHPGMHVFFNHHEQACAIAAEGYFRVTGKMSVVNVTTGPGSLNTLTGVMGQWTDSVPVLYLSGQVKFETTVYSCPELHLRQLGDQEINIIDIVKPVTKFAAALFDPADVRYVLEKAIYLATTGRPGPVWIDIPMNVQGASVDENELRGFDPDISGLEEKGKAIELRKIPQVLEYLEKSERPLLIAGHGIRLSGSKDLFIKIIDRLKIPVVTTFNGFDLVPSDHPDFIGRIGTIGDRAGNFALQNADLLISIGSRHNIRQISYNFKDYGRNAKKILIDIDPAEINKPTIQPDLALVIDAKVFLSEFGKLIRLENNLRWQWWTDWCLERKKKYPVVVPEYKDPKKKLNPYFFIQCLTSLLEEDAVMVAGNGSACVSLFQAGVVKKNQRIFWNSGCASMGYDLPAAIGACVGNNFRQVICLAGDGSMQMNIQELITVSFNKLPVKIFYLNNRGYISIRQTQENFFNGRIVGAGPESGVGFPDIIRVAKAYGLKTFSIRSVKNIDQLIKDVLSFPGPALCNVILNENYIFAPKVSSEKKPDGTIVSKPIEDMFPFLERKEYLSNIIIKEKDIDSV